MKYKIYTDGACSGNPGKGGWAAIILDKDLKLLVKDEVELKFLNKFSVEPKNINLNQLKTKTIKGGNIIKFNGFNII